jgi:hypothetical protein
MAKARLPASSIASPTPPGTGTTAPAEKGGTGRRHTRRGSVQNVRRYDFFIVYASPDRPRAQALSRLLKDKSCTVFLDAECIPLGTRWPSALREPHAVLSC